MCADGDAVQIGANCDAIFKRFMRAIGCTDLADASDLNDNAGRDTRRDELYAVSDSWATSLPLQEVLDILEAAEVPASGIYSVADMFRDSQFLPRDLLIQGQLPDGERVQHARHRIQVVGATRNRQPERVSVGRTYPFGSRRDGLRWRSDCSVAPGRRDLKSSSRLREAGGEIQAKIQAGGAVFCTITTRPHTDGAYAPPCWLINESPGRTE